MELGKLIKTYVVECADQCGSYAIFEPIKLDNGRSYAYKGVVENWLKMQGWQKIDELWTCYNCTIKQGREE